MEDKLKDKTHCDIFYHTDDGQPLPPLGQQLCNYGYWKYTSDGTKTKVTITDNPIISSNVNIRYDGKDFIVT